MARVLSLALSWSVAMLALSACDPADTKTHARASIDQYAALSTPRTLSQLVRNIDIVTADGRLLAKAFYTEENLQNAFGTANIRWHDREGTSEIVGDLGPFSAMESPAGKPLAYDASMVFSREVSERGSVSAFLSLRVRTSDSIRFEDIERVFGPSWKYSEQIAPLAHGLPPATTQPHGNAWIEYDAQVGGMHRRLKVGFHPNATLRYIESVVEPGT